MPDTTAYMLLGVAVTAVLMLGLVVSFWTRTRSYRHDLDVIAQITRDDFE